MLSVRILIDRKFFNTRDHNIVLVDICSQPPLAPISRTETIPPSAPAFLPAQRPSRLQKGSFVMRTLNLVRLVGAVTLIAAAPVLGVIAVYA